MTVHQPRSLVEALDVLAVHPDATVLAGGTDLMVGINAGRIRPERVVHLGSVDELRSWSVQPAAGAAGGTVTLGSGVTCAQMLDAAFAEVAPALTQAARTVGSPQIRAGATIGGNLGTASPAGDTLPVLVALDATVHVASATGTRELPVGEFLVGPKRQALLPGELITGVTVPTVAGPQEFLKIGVRTAMVIALCSVAMIVDLDQRSVAVGLGAAGPVPLRAPEAEAWIAERIDWARATVSDDDIEAFAARVAEAARPIDDHRGTADYRRHAIAVLSRRAMRRAFPGDGAVAA